MANVTLSPNMSLPVPQVGLDAGPQYATDVNSSLTIVDSHNHTPGFGVPIPVSGLSITTDLPINQNNLTLVRSIRFFPQATPITAITPDIGCVYVSGLDLYYNDLSGNQIQITSGGAVNATSSGITSGTASASFSGGVLIVDSNVATPANIQAGSILIGNNLANSKFLTLQPPNAMGASYTLTLPTIPAATGFLVMNTGGGISAAVNFSNPNFTGKAVQEDGLNLVVSNSNATNSIAIIRGVVSSTGGVSVGEGFTAAHNSTGNYSVNYTSVLNDPGVVVVTPFQQAFSDFLANIVSAGTNGFNVVTIRTGTGVFTDVGFNFIVMGQRT